MKIAIVLCAILGMSFAAPSTFSLKSDLQEIVDLIPLSDMRVIAKRYLDTDAEFQQIVAYLQGPGWAGIVATVGAHPTWIGFKEYLMEEDIDVDAIIEFIHDLIAGATPGGKGTRGVREFLDEILAIVPLDQIFVTINDKLENSEDFKTFYGRISSDKSRAFFEEIRALDEVQRIAQVLKDMGVDVDAVVSLIYLFLGWF